VSRRRAVLGASGAVIAEPERLLGERSMGVLAVGLSHKSASVALLERVALSGQDCDSFLAELLGSPEIDEAMAVSTCNRFEVYAEVNRFHPGVTAVCDLLSARTGVTREELARHLYVHYDDQAVQHLFAVACGLDSMVVGEGQILGQVRAALKDAQTNGTADRVLNDVAQRALRVGKRAHTETHLDRAGADMVSHGLSVALRHLAPGRVPAGEAASASGCAAVVAGGDRDLAATEVEAGLALPGPLTGRHVLILGAGSMSALAANTVARQGASRVVIANRTAERAARLAECLREAYEDVDTEAVPFDRAAEHLVGMDLVVSCTGAQGLVLAAHDVAPAVEHTARRMVFLDLALPHDIDPQVRNLDGVALVDIEALRMSAAQGPDGEGPRTAVVTEVTSIIDEEVAEYRSVRSAQQVTPTVKALRSRAAAVVEAELERLHGRLPDLEDAARDEVAYAMRRVVDKLLHAPTVRIKELAGEPGGADYATALRELFDLDPQAVAAVSNPEQERS
jgi:glutamyl-tRNA reductase